jgi:hypothetical protein
MTASYLLLLMLEMSDIPTENYQIIDEEASIWADHDEDCHGSYKSLKRTPNTHLDSSGVVTSARSQFHTALQPSTAPNRGRLKAKERKKKERKRKETEIDHEYRKALKEKDEEDFE